MRTLSNNHLEVNTARAEQECFVPGNGNNHTGFNYVEKNKGKKLINKNER